LIAKVIGTILSINIQSVTIHTLIDKIFVKSISVWWSNFEWIL